MGPLLQENHSLWVPGPITHNAIHTGQWMRWDAEPVAQNISCGEKTGKGLLRVRHPFSWTTTTCVVGPGEVFQSHLDSWQAL